MENTDPGYADRCAADSARSVPSIRLTLTHESDVQPLSLSSRCEAGDLAGKFGRLSADGDFSGTDDTGTLFLEGRYSIVGRSIVIHSAVDGSNFECGTIRSIEEIEMSESVVS